MVEWSILGANHNPVQVDFNEPTPDALNKVRASQRVSVLVHVSVTDEPSRNISEVISSEDYSSVARLYSVTAYVLRFVENLNRKRRGDILYKDALTAQELENAEHILLVVSLTETSTIGQQLRPDKESVRTVRGR